MSPALSDASGGGRDIHSAQNPLASGNALG